MATITTERRLWLTADGDSLVEDGDPQAAFLWSIAGRKVDADDAKRLGYKPNPGADEEQGDGREFDPSDPADFGSWLAAFAGLSEKQATTVADAFPTVDDLPDDTDEATEALAELKGIGEATVQRVLDAAGQLDS